MVVTIFPGGSHNGGGGRAAWSDQLLMGRPGSSTHIYIYVYLCTDPYMYKESGKFRRRMLTDKCTYALRRVHMPFWLKHLPRLTNVSALPPRGFHPLQNFKDICIYCVCIRGIRGVVGGMLISSRPVLQPLPRNSHLSSH